MALGASARAMWCYKALAMSNKPGDLRVLLLENIHPGAADLLRAEGLHVELRSGALDGGDLARALAGVDILGIRSKTRLTAEVLRDAPGLLAIGAFCIGTNQIALDAANRAGVPVFNAPFSNTRSVAELVIAEIIALARQLVDRSLEVHAGTWKKVAAGCFEVRGKTLGIIGYGHIGSQVGVLAEALGMRVLTHDIRTTLPIGNARATLTLHELLAASDFVTLHVPETPQTRGLVGARQLASMKPGSYLLNASRGSVVDIGALREALERGHLAGAAVDVFPEEPDANTADFATPLRGLPNVILTPHIAGSTVEAQAAIGREVAASLARFATLGTTTGAVNFPWAELPLRRGAHRVVNVHRNVPGVLRDINQIVSARNANIEAQHLGTDPHVGYLLMDMNDEVSSDVLADIARLETSIKTRIVH